MLRQAGGERSLELTLSPRLGCHLRAAVARGAQGCLEHAAEGAALVERVEPGLRDPAGAGDATGKLARIVRRGGGQCRGAVDRRQRQPRGLLARQPELDRKRHV